MKNAFDALMLEITLRPELGRLLSAALLSTAAVMLGFLVSRLLSRRSAASRSGVWRMVMLGLMLLAAWQMMPRSTQPMTLRLELTPPEKVQPQVMEQPPVFVFTPPTLWELALDVADEHGRSVWLGMAALLFITRSMRGWLSLRRLKLQALPVSERLQSSVQSVSHEMGISEHVPCVFVPCLGSPLLTGIWHARIWLPVEAEQWPDERLRAVFRHELAHLRRRDLGWQVLTRLTTCLWWWQPMAAVSARSLHAEAEQAADDHAVNHSGDAHSYARSLVEIAAGWQEQRATTPAAGVAMFGNRENLQHRVRELLRENHWRGRIGGGALVVLMIFSLLLLAVASTKLEFKPPQRNYTSLAKLVAGGRIVSSEGNVNWQEQMTDFYGTIIETLESAEMKKRALARARALHADLKDANVDIRVSQTKGSAIFNVFAVGSEPKFTKIFLDAMLDEFIAFRQKIREQSVDRALIIFTEAVVKKSKELQERTENLEAFRKANDVVDLAAGRTASATELVKAKTRLDEARQRLVDLDFMLADSASALSQLERGFTADGSTKLESSRGLTVTEQSYLKARAEAFALDQELQFLRDVKPPDAAAIAGIQQRAAKARHLETSWKAELALQCQDQRKARRGI
ncbi:MAG: M56 family metallopeptidase [Prosthecobacter sp.]